MKVPMFLFATNWLTGAACSTINTACCDCDSLKVPEIEGATLINTTATERHNVSVTAGGLTTSINFCEVKTYLTHGDSGDAVLFQTWLPLSAWNGRYTGVGGGGWLAGYVPNADLTLDENPVGVAVAQGFAASVTDAGTGSVIDPRSWANSTQIAINFVHLSVHEMTIIGKSLTSQFYGTDEFYSYWVGCSQGGRQGYIEAQMYPEDYDGIYAFAPGINWDALLTEIIWPDVVMHDLGRVDLCKFHAISNSSIAACDALDGSQDGLISNPDKCRFNSYSLIGTPAASCNEVSRNTISKQDVRAWELIRTGPINADGRQLYPGLAYGTPYDAAMKFDRGVPNSDRWVTDFVLRWPDLNVSTISIPQFFDIFAKSFSEFHAFWGSDNPDLSEFKRQGKKLLTWHGWADDIVSPVATVQYWDKVVDRLGGQGEVDDFYRVFMAPGVGHCTGGVGPEPSLVNVTQALIEWVENGVVPETIPANKDGVSRNLCTHPRSLMYKGDGDINLAESWTCVDETSVEFCG